MALVPYPAATAVATREAARVAIRAALGASESELSDDAIDRLAGVSAARIQKFAPAAPDEVKDESLIRLVSYLRQLPTGLRRVEVIEPRAAVSGVPNFRRADTGDTVTIEFGVSGMERPFRACGARSLLAPWVARRALPAEDAS